MPRKPLLYTHELPYHISARANNKEWFYLPISECWEIFRSNLTLIHDKFGFEVHAFVLMNNHYHLLGQCSQEHDLGEVMAWFQKSVSRKINGRTGRINHIFGGPYRASLISHEHHYAQVYKYIARNPVKAGLSDLIELYPYSTFNSRVYLSDRAIRVVHSLQWGSEIPKDRVEYLSWLNTNFDEWMYVLLSAGLRKTEFRPKDRQTRSDPFLTRTIYQK